MSYGIVNRNVPSPPRVFFSRVKFVLKKEREWIRKIAIDGIQEKVKEIEQQLIGSSSKTVNESDDEDFNVFEVEHNNIFNAATVHNEDGNEVDKVKEERGPSGGRVVPAQARPRKTWESQERKTWWESQERKTTGTWTLPTPPRPPAPHQGHSCQPGMERLPPTTVQVHKNLLLPCQPEARRPRGSLKQA